MKKVSLIVIFTVIFTGCSSVNTNSNSEINLTVEPELSEMTLTPIDEDQAELIDSQGQDSPIIEGHTFDDPEWEAVKAAIIEVSPEAYISSFYMPELDGKIYASAVTNVEFDPIAEVELSTLTVYSYDQDSQEITEIYQRDQDNYIGLAGLDGENLLFTGLISMDYSPGPCVQIWNNQYATFYKLNLENPNQLESYEVLDSLIEMSDQRELECEKTL